MTRRWISCAALAAILVAVRGSQAEVRDGRLGSACASDADCAFEGLTCLLPASGPAGGLCSVSCAYDDQCLRLGETAFCGLYLGDAELGYCVEGCEIDVWFGQQLDPTKCHGRPDMACTGGCLPQCTRDAQCGAGLFCNASDGLCETSPPEGDPPGTPCPGLKDCAGTCSGGLCREPCVIGDALACSLSSQSSGRAWACLLPASGSSLGDLGYCAEFCNCSSDCSGSSVPTTDGLAAVCDPWDFGGRFDAVGVCERGRVAIGAPDCSGRSGCFDGPARACRIGACLGTADCVDGGYSECNCIDGGSSGDSDGGDAGGFDAASPGRGDAASDAASPEASGQRARGADCNCSVPTTRCDSRTLVLLSMLLGATARRIRRRSMGRVSSPIPSKNLR